LPEHTQYQPPSGGVGWDPELLGAAENQFQLRLGLAWKRCFGGWRCRRLYQREPNPWFRSTAELPPPPVERMLPQLMLAARRAHCLAAVLLLRDSLAPKLSLAHSSTLRRNFGFRQRVHVMLTNIGSVPQRVIAACAPPT
jgi:hypothetical protein